MEGMQTPSFQDPRYILNTSASRPVRGQASIPELLLLCRRLARRWGLRPQRPMCAGVGLGEWLFPNYRVRVSSRMCLLGALLWYPGVSTPRWPSEYFMGLISYRWALSSTRLHSNMDL
ncbi:hypothetical protein K491DRAFT_292649 [Lophiostoma macrostomum CBS 122681]|uniref:Uncharacterized protein n=1 Tax=Lophiostoma macrostomum CBS 122681 TaxID=1314788 RepID=A0A6A6SJA4_9PLEO|nr:hypothetical protein K491DRAFT_292649 [Lophiostoma macrostomum CBS 122681]